MANFSLVALRILESNPDNIIKILSKEERGWFLFNQSYKVEKDKLKLNTNYPLNDDFFGKNISINAIVGKNGSGKSSLLELLFRMIYNLSVKMELLNPIGDEYKPSTLIGIYVELYYTVEKKLFKLVNKGQDISLFERIEEENDDWEEIENKDDDKYFPLKSFFYSIVVNYSIQAYISNDYRDDIDQDYPWIDYLFHKNDGYTVPLVLNPKRDYGKIDMNNEYSLSIQRLSALLIDNPKFIDKYELNTIIAEYNPSKVTEKFTQSTVAKICNFYNAFEYSENSIFCKILDEYDIKYPYVKKARQNNQQQSQNSNTLNPDNITTQTLSLPPEPIDIAYHYLVLKTISISNTYDNYKAFKININTRKYDLQQDEFNIPSNCDIKGLVKTIKEDNSHITLKIKQILNFIEYTKTHTITKDTVLEYNYLSGSSLYDNSTELSYLDKKIVALPPSFYKSEIQFNKLNNRITLDKMSSGERQFLLSMSTVLYHIKNLMSVPKNDEKRVKYKSFNIILDEIELCFHPEYQREFVNGLVGYLERIVPEKEKDKYHFNIILSTHSPFILSDIPNCNIMYLEEGKQIPSEKMPETFSANIHDILKHSFFLENGFIGEFARKKIGEIITAINKNKINESIYKEYKKIIDLIGEPLIKRKLMQMINEVYDNKEDIISMLQKEIDNLKSNKNK